MIGKISIGKDFGGCIKYLLEGRNGEKKDLAELLHYNNCCGDKNELAQQFRDVKALNRKIEKPVWHTSLSFAHNDKLSKHQLIEISEKLAKKFGFEKNQYLVVQHHDTKHQHIHIVSNRVGFDSKAISTSKNYQKVSDFSRRIEKEYNLEQVLSPEKFLGKDRKEIPRLDKRKDQIKEIINEALSKSKSYDDFKSFVEKNNLKIEKGRGIAFIDNKGVRLKGSQIGFSLKKIQNILSLTKIYRPELIIKKVISKALDYER
ncbi:MAG: relaxase/mobilization nuclease domain-containing protein [Bacteroidales bacterium]|jgi:hypothetical protein|nr:relaxase/mobilization nuclease domain-containing protein [Bacteroidales bacterium]